MRISNYPYKSQEPQLDDNQKPSVPKEEAAGHPGRRPLRPEDRELTPATLRWLAALPPNVRPIITGQKHPHVLNRLCEAWQWPMRMRNQFLELMIDQRGTRRGFSFEVLNELSTLQSHYAAQLTREQRAFWDDHRRLL